jgi:hypothetical protein
VEYPVFTAGLGEVMSNLNEAGAGREDVNDGVVVRLGVEFTDDETGD